MEFYLEYIKFSKNRGKIEGGVSEISGTVILKEACGTMIAFHKGR